MKAKKGRNVEGREVRRSARREGELGQQVSDA